MTAWLLASPSLMDSTFPRNETELHHARQAVLALDGLLSAGGYQLLLTPLLVDLMTLVEWKGMSTAQIYDLRRLVDDFLIRPAGRTITVHFNKSDQASAYPAPPCLAKSSFADMWSDEVGQLAELCREAGVTEPIIGIACSQAMAGESKCSLPELKPPVSLLPLLGPTTLSLLSSAYEPVYDEAAIRRAIPLSAVREHWRALGALKLRSSSGSSHLEILEFPGRSWPLDVNDDPIPPNNLRTLVQCVGLPKKWVKTILLTGQPPRMKPVLEHCPRVNYTT